MLSERRLFLNTLSLHWCLLSQYSNPKLPHEYWNVEIPASTILRYLSTTSYYILFTNNRYSNLDIMSLIFPIQESRTPRIPYSDSYCDTPIQNYRPRQSDSTTENCRHIIRSFWIRAHKFRLSILLSTPQTSTYIKSISHTPILMT